MARFTIDIPNIGQVVVDGPFATEDSIKALAAALGKSQSTTRSKSNKEKQNDQLFDDLNDNIDLTVDSFDRLQQESEASSKVFSRLSNGLDRTIGGFKNLVAGSQSVSGGFGKMVETLGDGAASITGLIPGVGSVVTAFTGMVATAIGFIEGLKDVNVQLMNVGATFAGGIDEFQFAAEAGGVSLNSLTKSITTNTDSFRMLSGGLIGGTKTISKAFRNLGTQQQEILYSMGYSTEEILSGMADFAAMAKLSGKDLNMEEIAKGGADYLKVQRELTRLTGKNAEQLKSEREALRSRAEFQAFFNKIADPKLREAVENGILAVPDAAKDMVSRLIRGTPITDPAMLRVLSTIPGLQGKFESLGNAVESGAISGEEYTKKFNDLVNLLNKDSKSVIDAQGPLLQIYRESSDVINKEMEIRESLSRTSLGFDESLKSSNAAMDLITGPTGALSRALGVFSRYDEEMSVILNSIGTAMGKFFNPSGGEFQKILDNVLAFGKSVSAAMNEYVSDPKAKIGDLWDKVYNSFTAHFGNIFDITTGVLGGWMESLGTMLSDSISFGIEKGFSAIASYFGIETELQKKETAKEKAAAFKTEEGATAPPASITNQRKIVTAGRGGVGYASMSAEQKMMQELYDAMEELSDNDVLAQGYLRSIDSAGKNRYDKLSAENLGRYPTGIEKSSPSISNQALGNVFQPRPGGHVIRVAEAMEPELVAPASKGADGKLGLEISGVHLDNSKLLSRLDQGATLKQTSFLIR